MQFNQDKPIYLQMMDRLCDDILADVLIEENRIPSVREYAATLGVNTNTAVKSYDELSRREIIYNRRGMGYYVAVGAKERIREERKREFFDRQVPQLRKEMRLLNISLEELQDALKE